MPVENACCSSTFRNVCSEIRGYYRDLIKSIPAQKERFRLAVPEGVVKKNIRDLFEEGPKLTVCSLVHHIFVFQLSLSPNLGGV